MPTQNAAPGLKEGKRQEKRNTHLTSDLEADQLLDN